MAGKPRQSRAYLDGDLCIIPLSRGMTAIADAADFAAIASKTWTARVNGHYRSAYHCWKDRETGRRYSVSLAAFLDPPPPGFFVDHISGDALDNRRKNLRFATPTENVRNRAVKVGKPIPYKGVYPSSRNTFRARICLGGRNVNLGSFLTPEAAAAAYDAMASAVYGDFARLNFSRVA